MGLMSSKNKDQLLLASLIFFILKCASNVQAEVNEAFSIPFTLNNIDAEMESLQDSGPNALLSPENLDKASDVLAKLLLFPWPKGGSPLLYVEQPGTPVETGPYYNVNENDMDNDGSLRPITPKRSKYYRKYPWKRQQNNIRYEPAYMCVPDKDDVYRLLVAVHGERDGYRGQLVDFCNRKRPASLVFTNIRFIG